MQSHLYGNGCIEMIGNALIIVGVIGGNDYNYASFVGKKHRRDERTGPSSDQYYIFYSYGKHFLLETPVLGLCISLETES